MSPSVVAEDMSFKPEKVPKRLSAEIIDQRMSAQYGQNSPPS